MYLQKFKKYLWNFLRSAFSISWRPSYSQYGEDLIAAAYLANVKSGFFVDIGAHHPTKSSNTYFFYLKGWRGINVDAKPGSMARFTKSRPRDINIEAGVARLAGTRTFYMFDEPAVNTFNTAAAKLLAADGIYTSQGTAEVEVHPLSAILDKWLPAGQKINLLSVDVEGLELEVLQSNNWQKYRPDTILVELNNADIATAAKCPVARELAGLNYRFMAKSFNTLLFVSND